MEEPLRSILAGMPLVPVPFVPEIRLRTAAPSSGLRRLAEARPGGPDRPPYWAFVWGGGAVLARYILDHPPCVAGRRVLDLGAGGGIVGIAAALAGAPAVAAADIDPDALVALALNAQANGVAIETFSGDLTTGPAPDTDLILVGDLFYERELAERVTPFLDRCLTAGLKVLIGDPQRSHLPRERLRLLAEYAAPDFGDGARAAASPGAVFAFE